mmetsp:Transcript_89465/g.230946  ORF Transcript_89465/g.230946 Transcript_89465/m.230946 type:complete len:217 (-) Transcript_89465:2-652(-)
MFIFDSESFSSNLSAAFSLSSIALVPFSLFSRSLAEWRCPSSLPNRFRLRLSFALGFPSSSFSLFFSSSPSFSSFFSSFPSSSCFCPSSAFLSSPLASFFSSFSSSSLSLGLLSSEPLRERLRFFSLPGSFASPASACDHGLAPSSRSAKMRALFASILRMLSSIRTLSRLRSASWRSSSRLEGSSRESGIAFGPARPWASRLRPRPARGPSAPDT